MHHLEKQNCWWGGSQLCPRLSLEVPFCKPASPLLKRQPIDAKVIFHGSRDRKAGALVGGRWGESCSQWEGQGKDGKRAGRAYDQDKVPLRVKRAKCRGCWDASRLQHMCGPPHTPVSQADESHALPGHMETSPDACKSAKLIQSLCGPCPKGTWGGGLPSFLQHLGRLWK